MVDNSDYVVYVNEKVQKTEKVVEEEPKNKYNSLEEEYQEKIREANLEMRKQRGDYDEAENADGKADEYLIKPVDINQMSGKEAFFSLMAMKMMKLAKKY